MMWEVTLPPLPSPRSTQDAPGATEGHRAVAGDMIGCKNECVMVTVLVLRGTHARDSGEKQPHFPLKEGRIGQRVEVNQMISLEAPHLHNVSMSGCIELLTTNVTKF
jgi:hypothetical protein